VVQDIVTESESFDVEKFIPLLQKYIRRANPYIRQLLVRVKRGNREQGSAAQTPRLSCLTKATTVRPRTFQAPTRWFRPVLFRGCMG